MNNLTSKIFKKKTTRLYSYNALPGLGRLDPTVGETDPTNTTITVLTTVSGPAMAGGQKNMVEVRA